MTGLEIIKILKAHRPERPRLQAMRRYQKAIDEAVDQIESFEKWRDKNDLKYAGIELTGGEVIFFDGILNIIEEGGQKSHYIIIAGGYDKQFPNGLSLATIREKYNGKVVIHQNAFDGSVFLYGNRGKFWEQIGTTIGFA